MKKLAIVLALFLALVLGAGPWFMGRVAHSRIDHGLDSLVEKVPYIKIVERTWHQGWFRSESLVTFEFVVPGIGNKPVSALADAAPAREPAPQEIPKFPLLAPLRISVRSEVLHGPVLGGAGIGLARLDTKFLISEETRQKLMEVMGTDDLVRIRTRMGFLGGGTTTLSGEGRSVPLDKLGMARASGSIAWDDFSLAIGMASKGRSYDVSGKQPRIEFRNADGSEHVLFGKIRVQGKGSLVTEDLYDGDVAFGIGKVSVTSSRSPAVDVSDVHYTVQSTNKGDFFDYALRMGTGEVKTTALDALKVQLKEIHYDMTLRHLHAPTLQKLTRTVRDTYSGPMLDPVTAQTALIGPLTEQSKALLKYDPELVLDRIGIVTGKGEAAFKGTIKLVGVTDEDLKSGSLALIPKLSADITFEAPQALFDEVPNGNLMMGMGLDQGYVKREGGKVTSHIEFKGGKLSINGKSPQLPPMFGGQQSAPAVELPVEPPTSQ
jgi:uncharacterized protein YdgA (DUF945 family)